MLNNPSLFRSGYQPPTPIQQSKALLSTNRIVAKQKEDEEKAKRIQAFSKNKMVYPQRPTSPGNEASPNFVGAIRPSNLPKPNMFNNLQKKAINLPASLYSQKKQFGQSFVKSGKESLKNLWVISQPTRKLFSDKETRKDLVEGLKVVKDATVKKADQIGSGVVTTIKQPKLAGQILRNESLPNLKAGLFVAGAGATGIATNLVDLSKTPTGRGKLAYGVAELAAFAAAGEGAKAGDFFLRNKWVKLGAKEISIDDFISTQAIKEGLPTTALPKVKSIKELVTKGEASKGFYKEYPEHYVFTTAEPVATKDAIKIFTQADKKALGIKTRIEDAGIWSASKGEANIWALRLNGGSSYKDLKFSLFPKLSKTGTPGYKDILVKRIERLPEKVLQTDVKFDVVSKYQKFLSKTKPSTMSIAKRSETSKIGDSEIIKWIRKVDPKTPGSSENQFIQMAGSILQPAAKLKPTSLLGRFKGYDEFLNINGVAVPFRKAIVSGASIYRKGAIDTSFRNLKLAGQKGFADIFGSTRKTLNSELGKVADFFGERSFQKSKSNVSLKKYFSQPTVLNVNLGGAGLGYFATSNPRIKNTASFVGINPSYPNVNTNYNINSNYNINTNSNSFTKITKPDYSGVFYNKDNSSYVPTKPSDEIRNIIKPYDDGGRPPPPPPTDDGGRPPPPPPTDEYPIISKPKPYTPNYPSKPYLTLKTPPTTTTTRLFGRSSSKKPYKKDTYTPSQAFDVLVRTTGKWTKVSTPKTLNYFAAKQKGFSIADNYAERSVKLKPTNKTAQIISNKNPKNAYKFSWNKSKNKKLKLSFIEKSKYAIDTKGEFNKITYKGIMSRKKKKGFVF